MLTGCQNSEQLVWGVNNMVRIYSLQAVSGVKTPGYGHSIDPSFLARLCISNFITDVVDVFFVFPAVFYDAVDWDVLT